MSAPILNHKTCLLPTFADSFCLSTGRTTQTSPQKSVYGVDESRVKRTATAQQQQQKKMYNVKRKIITIGYDFHNKSNALSVFTRALREMKPMGIVQYRTKRS